MAHPVSRPQLSHPRDIIRTAFSGSVLIGALAFATVSLVPVSADASIRSCRIFTEKGVHASALIACTSVIESSRSSAATKAEALFYRANSHYSTRDIEAATDDINGSLDLRPNYGPALALRAAINSQIGNMTAAIADLNKAINLGQTGADIYSRRAAARLTTGDLRGAASDLAAVTAAAPRDAIAHLRLAITLNELGRNGPAMDAANRAVALNRDFSDAYGVRAKIKSESGDLEGALEDFARAQSGAAEGIRYLIGKADLLARSGRLEDGLTTLDEALTKDPASRTAHLLKADILQNAGRIEAAREALAGLAATDAQIALRRARLAINANDLDAATNDYTAAIALDPALTAAYYERGQIHAARGQLAAALADFDQTLAADATYADRGLFLLRGKANFRAGNYREAAADFSQDLKIQDTADGHIWRALSYSELGEFKPALEDAARLIALAPGEAKAHAVLGDVLLKAGRLADGKKSHQRALAIDPGFAPSLQRMNELSQAE